LQQNKTGRGFILKNVEKHIIDFPFHVNSPDGAKQTAVPQWRGGAILGHPLKGMKYRVQRIFRGMLD